MSDDPRYPEPDNGSREGRIMAALKAHRTLERVKMTTDEQTATGPALSDWFTELLDVWRLVADLPYVPRRILELYYLSEAPNGSQRSDEDIGRDREIGMSRAQVQRMRRKAIRDLADRHFQDDR